MKLPLLPFRDDNRNHEDLSMQSMQVLYEVHAASFTYHI